MIICGLVFLILLPSWSVDCSRLKNSTRECNNGFCIPRIVWFYWGDDVFPEDIQEMNDVSSRSLADFFTCLVVTPKNVSDYLDVRTFPPGFDEVCVQGRADYVRVSILEKFGGLYIDSSTYVNSGIEVEYLFLQALKAKRSVFGFEKQIAPMKFLLELNFYGACQGSVFMKKYKEEYEIALKGENIHMYVLKICYQLRRANFGPKYKYFLNVECENDYFLANNVFLNVAFNNPLMANDVLMFRSTHNQYRLTKECNLNVECVRHRLLHDPVARAYAIIKVTRSQRNGKRFHIKDLEYNDQLNKLRHRDSGKKRMGLRRIDKKRL